MFHYVIIIEIYAVISMMLLLSNGSNVDSFVNSIQFIDMQKKQYGILSSFLAFFVFAPTVFKKFSQFFSRKL